METIKLSRQSMVNSGLPVHPWQRRSLRVGDRNYRHVSKLPVKRNQIRNIQPTVQCRHVRDWLSATQREVQIINMKMDDIELRSALKHMLKHQDLVGQLIHAVFVQSQ